MKRETRDPPSLAQAPDRGRDGVVAAGDIEPPLRSCVPRAVRAPGRRRGGRWRKAMAIISSVTAISRLSGAPTFVEKRAQALDVGVGDVAAILAKVCGDAVRTGGKGRLRRAKRLRVRAAAGRCGWSLRDQC